MCGRFGFNESKDLIAEFFGLDEGKLPELLPRYNIAPTQDVPVIRFEGKGRTLDLLRWGWMPGWAKSVLINAKSETAAEKPTFKQALAERRCLIPASGFFEWKRSKTEKQPYWIHPKEGKPLAFAGLWTTEKTEDGKPVHACVILTTGPNKVMEPIHNRMPVIIPPVAFGAWLEDGTPKYLRPCPDSLLRADAVSSYVNNAKNQGPKCLELVGT